VILKNGKSGHAVSKPMQRQSAPRQVLQAPAKPTVAKSPFKSRVLNRVHLNQVSNENDNNSNVKEEKENVALNTEKSTEKHRKKNKYYHHGAQHKPYQHKRNSKPELSKYSINDKRSRDAPSSSSGGDFMSPRSIKYKPPEESLPISPNRQQILITKKNSLNTKVDVAARTKDFRIKGSDLYVTRLGSCNVTPPQTSRSQPADSPPAPAPSPNSEPSSLYDELSASSRTPSPYTAPANSVLGKHEIRASRPCYRCVSAMHAVGIKRVFWTNADGEWEGAKVRDLVDALEMDIEGDDGDGPGMGQGNKGVFVTKHEVLMLKRIMGF